MHIFCKFGDSSSNPLKVIVRKSWRFLSRNGQNDLEGQCQWPPFSIPAKSIPGYMFGANLVVLAQIYEELSHGRATIPRILSQNGQNDLEGQCQWPPFSIPAKSILLCIFWNLVILTQIYEELSRRQAKIPIILSQNGPNGQNDLEGQGQWPLFSIPTKSIPWCMFGANLVIPDQICDELSCGQGEVYGQTDRRTGAGNDNTLRPERPRGKNDLIIVVISMKFIPWSPILV